MHPQKKTMLWIILVGGTAVIGSYLVGFVPHPENVAAFWGGVPGYLIPLYTTSMLLAALSFFAFSYFLLFRLDPVEARVGNRCRFRVFNWIYLGILLPSALWMPLTGAMIQSPGAGLWYGIRLVLALVGLASLDMTAALLVTRPKEPRWAYWLAVTGSAIFFIHTGILDALVWPALFPK